jgi:hypothetical protein
MASEKEYDVEQRLNNHIGTHRAIQTATQSNSLATSFSGVGCAIDLAAGASYQFRGLLLCTFTASGGTMTYRLHPTNGLAASSFRAILVEFVNAQGPVTDKNSALDGTLTGSVVGTGLSDRYAMLEGFITVSTAGTMATQGALSSGSGTMIQSGSYLEVTQVT